MSEIANLDGRASDGGPAATRDAGPPEQLRSRILEVAIERFAAQGYAATSVREIVEAAGCTKPALYYHFESKQGLFLAAVAQAEARMEHVGDPMSHGSSFAAALAGEMTRLHAHVLARPDDLRLLFHAQNHAAIDPDLFDCRPIRAAHLAEVERMLRIGIEQGEVRADLPVEDAAIALVGMMHFELQLWLDGRPLAENFADRMVSIYMRGVAG